MTPTPRDLSPTRGVLYAFVFSAPVWFAVGLLIWWASC